MEQSTLETRLLSGRLDGELTCLYGAEHLEAARSRCAAVLSGFAKTFECLPEALFSAPRPHGAGRQPHRPPARPGPGRRGESGHLAAAAPTRAA